MNLSIIILLLTFLLIAVRQVGNVRLQIWQVMLMGATAMLLTGQITPIAAWQAINFDVLLFLFGMFVVGYALEESGYLAQIAHFFFSRTASPNQLLLMTLFLFGIGSALLMNDTVAIIGTPLVLALAKRHRVSAQIMLLALAFGVTVGSVMSPIGNPQNLLIALTGTMANPFLTFLKYLFLPTLINLVVTFVALKYLFRFEAAPVFSEYRREPLRDGRLANLSKIALIILIVLIALKISAVIVGFGLEFRLTYIALVAALPIIAFSPRRIQIVRHVDWSTLVFFASMFIVMASVWNSGFFQELMRKSTWNIGSLSVIMIVSVIVSQFISNVPLVALYLPLLLGAGAGERAMVALAAGSTIAGNLLILGAASNVIIIQNAEQRTGDSLSFLQFARVGIPLTIVHVAVYWLFLILI
jgi:Na+/H+ antiporter NhaD/arsenite permease-like protein